MFIYRRGGSAPYKVFAARILRNILLSAPRIYYILIHGTLTCRLYAEPAQRLIYGYFLIYYYILIPYFLQ